MIEVCLKIKMKTPRRRDSGGSLDRFIILKIPPCPPFPKWGWRKPDSPESFRDGNNGQKEEFKHRTDKELLSVE